MLDINNQAFIDIAEYTKNIGIISTDAVWHGLKNISNLLIDKIFNTDVIKTLNETMQKAHSEKREIERLSNTPAGLAFETEFKKSRGVEFDVAKVQSFKSKSEEYLFVKNCKNQYERLKVGIKELKKLYNEQKKLDYVLSDIEGFEFENKTTAKKMINDKLTEILTPFCGNDENLRDQLIAEITKDIDSENIFSKKTLDMLDKLKDNAQKLYESQLNGKSFDEYHSEYIAAYAETFGGEEAQTEAEAWIAKQETGTQTIRTAAVIAATVMTGGSATLAKGSAQLASKIGSTAAQQIVKFGMTLEGVAVGTGLDYLNALTSKAGLTEERNRQILQSTIHTLPYALFGAYVSGPIGDKVVKILNGSSSTILPNILKNTFATTNKGLGFATEVGLDVLLECALSDGDLSEIIKGNVKGEAQGRLLNMLIGGRAHGATKTILQNAGLDGYSAKQNYDGTYTVKTPDGKTHIATVEDMGIIVGKIIDAAVKNEEIKTQSGVAETSSESPLSFRLQAAKTREEFVEIKKEIMAMPDGDEKSKMRKTYLDSYNKWVQEYNKSFDIRMEYQPDKPVKLSEILERIENAKTLDELRNIRYGIPSDIDYQKWEQIDIKLSGKESSIRFTKWSEGYNRIQETLALSPKEMQELHYSIDYENQRIVDLVILSIVRDADYEQLIKFCKMGGAMQIDARVEVMEKALKGEAEFDKIYSLIEECRKYDIYDMDTITKKFNEICNGNDAYFRLDNEISKYKKRKEFSRAESILLGDNKVIDPLVQKAVSKIPSDRKGMDYLNQVKNIGYAQHFIKYDSFKDMPLAVQKDFLDFIECYSNCPYEEMFSRNLIEEIRSGRAVTEISMSLKESVKPLPENRIIEINKLFSEPESYTNKSSEEIIKIFESDCAEIFKNGGYKLTDTSINKLKSIIQNDSFKNLSASDQKVLMLSVLLSDSGNSSLTPNQLAFNAYAVGQNLGLSSPIAEKVAMLVKYKDITIQHENMNDDIYTLPTARGNQSLRTTKKLTFEQRAAYDLKNSNTLDLLKLITSVPKQVEISVEAIKEFAFLKPQSSKEELLSHSEEIEITSGSGKKYKIRAVNRKTVQGFRSYMHTVNSKWADAIYGGAGSSNNYDKFVEYFNTPMNDRVICAGYADGYTGIGNGVLLLQVAPGKEMATSSCDMYSLGKNFDEFSAEFWMYGRNIDLISLEQKAIKKEPHHLDDITEEEYSAGINQIYEQLDGEILTPDKLKTLSPKIAQNSGFATDQTSGFEAMTTESLVNLSNGGCVSGMYFNEIPTRLDDATIKWLIKHNIPIVYN